MSKLMKIAFKGCVYVLPSYKNKFANKIKNILAKYPIMEVGKNVNWGTKIRVTANLKIGNNSGIGDRSIINGL